MAVTGTENWGSILENQPERRLIFLRKAAGVKITQSQFVEVVNRHNILGPSGSERVMNSI